MSALKRKKKTLKQRQKTLRKDPSIILTALLEVTQKYYKDLSIKREPPHCPECEKINSEDEKHK